ncbi:kinase-like domain-containing protein [Coniochaeta sp. 2T2.1]|nr:kinase-like domain-containing protein [Coniochaeta sp. 2T2.1]
MPASSSPEPVIRRPQKVLGAWGKVAAAQKQAEEEDLLNFQKEMTDYFQLWRQGDDQIFDYNPEHRRKQLEELQFPRATPWKGLQGRRRGQIYGVAKRRLLPKFDGTAIERGKDMNKKLRPTGLKVRKVLGAGGGGIACEVDGKDSDGKVVKLVCKTSFRIQMEAEKDMHILMAGARHIVQRVVLGGKLELDEEERERIAKNKGKPTRDVTDVELMTPLQQLDARRDMLFIEFMRRGDLERSLAKAATSKTRFPDYLLWKIFDCLFKGVVAMAVPRGWNNTFKNPMHYNVSQETEELRSFTVPGTLVHFDLDPQNILIGDCDEGWEHEIVPILKIADLGLSRVVDPELRADVDEMWGSRRAGKTRYLTPEQFTEEWDYIKGAPVDEAADPNVADTAGNYSWWTNLYQVGQVMWQLITLHGLEWPRTAQQVELRNARGEGELIWTYGSWLLDPRFKDTDLQLRMLVMRCMNHKPAERPTLAELDGILEDKVRTTRPSLEEQEATKSFCAKIFEAPPPPAPKPATLGTVAQNVPAEASHHGSSRTGASPAGLGASRAGENSQPGEDGDTAMKDVYIGPQDLPW